MEVEVRLGGGEDGVCVDRSRGFWGVFFCFVNLVLVFVFIKFMKCLIFV